MRPLFVYGTLMDSDLLKAVLGRELRGVERMPARLADHAVERAQGAAFPMLVARPGAVAEGMLLIGLTRADMVRLEAYETALYQREPCLAETTSGAVAAELFLATGRLKSSGEPWRLADWQARHKRAVLGEES